MKVFEIDTSGGEGSKGPWLSWSSNGSAEKGFPPRSWTLRDKLEGGGKTEIVVPAFTAGCVLDLDTVKIGWEKDVKGMAPERRWSASPAKRDPRPDESKRHDGKYVWTKAFHVRCAIGGGRAATWEQGAFAAHEAFMTLAKQIQAEWKDKSQNGLLLPLVKMVSVEKRNLPGGDANIPVLQVVQWVPRPDCLKANAPVYDLDETTAKPAAAPAPQPTYTPPPPAAASVAADIAF